MEVEMNSARSSKDDGTGASVNIPATTEPIEHKDSSLQTNSRADFHPSEPTLRTHVASDRSSSVSPPNQTQKTLLSPAPGQTVLTVSEPQLDTHHEPKARPLGLLKLFLLFLSFGFRAWGGPVVQIAMFRSYFVDKLKWISNQRFIRVLAVYQALPGPEATELCCFFGMLSRGRIGSFLAGLGFVLPGFGFVLLLSFLYDKYDIINEAVFRASFTAVQATVAAMVFRAVHKIGEAALKDHQTKQLSSALLYLALCSMLQYVFNINVFITMGFCGVVNMFFSLDRTRVASLQTSNQVNPADTNADAAKQPQQSNSNSNSNPEKPLPLDRTSSQLDEGEPELEALSKVRDWVANLPEWSNLHRWHLVNILFHGLGIMGYILYVNYVGWPGSGNISSGNTSDTSLSSLFVTGLLAGLLTFGGAYTAIPFVHQNVTAWMSSSVFLDGLALTSICPTPLVMFTVFVGYLGHGVGGAVVMAIGMFLPAFSFTLIGHEVFEKIVEFEAVSAALDGITASVIGQIAITSLQLMRTAVLDQSPLTAVVYLLSLSFLYNITHPLGSILLLFLSAVAGQILFL